MFDPDAVFASCPSGAATGAWRTTLERGIGPVDRMRPGQALTVWVADLLRRELPNHADGVTLWISESGVPEAKLASVAHDSSGQPPPLTITDGRMVWVFGTDHPFDVATGKIAREAGADWFQVSVFNLRALYQLCHDRAVKWIEQQPKSGQTPTVPPSVS
jgi:hypothetical protein